MVILVICRTTSVQISFTNPTPIKSTPWTIHRVAPIILLDTNFTTWTVSSIGIQGDPKLKLNFARHLAFSYVPWISAFKAYFLATRAHWLISTACLLNNLFAIRFGAPLFTFVFAHLNVLFNCFVFVLDVLRAKHLDLFYCEFLFTQLFRAANFENFTSLDLNFEMIAHTIHTKSMFAL